MFIIRTTIRMCKVEIHQEFHHGIVCIGNEGRHNKIPNIPLDYL